MGKYFKYAIGEIVLVVIGILIALQINNWNQNRLNANQKKILLANLHEEFKENKDILKRYKKGSISAFNGFTVLMNLVGESRQKLLEHNLDSIFFESLAANELAFTENTLNNIAQSGQLNLFKNDKILDLMNQWSALSVIRKNRMDKSNYWNNNHLLPFLIPNISFKEMDANGDYKWAGKSKVKPDYYPLFQKVEFENYIDNALWYWQQILDRLEETDILINKIIEATKSN